MAVVTRNMLPVVEPRRRPGHREIAHRPSGIRRTPTTPARELAFVAVSTLRRARPLEGRPRRWAAPSFGRDVDLVRRHLAPIRSRTGLAASFGREAFQGDPAANGTGADAGPVTVAYAIRWLELGDGIARPPWEAWLAAGEVQGSSA